MKQYGITRRIDELGRIVIPKEIRHKMHLKTGELLEIYISDDEKIVLKKHSIIRKDEHFLNLFIKSLSNIIGSDIYVTNLNQVVLSSDSMLIGKNLNKELETIIGNTIKLNGLSELKIADNLILRNDFKIEPIFINGDFIGLFIIATYNKEENEKIVKLSLKLLESYFESA